MAKVYTYKCINERCKQFADEYKSTAVPSPMQPRECTWCRHSMYSRGQIAHLEEHRLMERKPRIVNKCRDCGRGVPAGYLAVVVKWVSVVWGKGYTSHVAEVVLCRDCGKGQVTAKRYERERKALVASTLIGEPEEVELTPKEIAVKMLQLLGSYKKPHSVEWLCKQAGIEFSDVVLEVLKALKNVGKVIKLEGRWLKA